MTNRTGADITTAFVMLVGLAAGVCFGGITGTLYTPRDSVEGIAAGIGAVTGFLAGFYWARVMIPRRRVADWYICIGKGTGLGVLLGLGSAFVVHTAFGVGTILCAPYLSRGEFFERPDSLVTWLLNCVLAWGIPFGLGVGLVAGLVSSIVLVLTVRPEQSPQESKSHTPNIASQGRTSA